MGTFPLPHQFVSWFCSVSSQHTKTEFSKSSLSLCSLGVFFPQQLAPIPPFPLMNWHAGRNICYYSHFLTACAAWIGSCSGRKQLSGKCGGIRTMRNLSQLLAYNVKCEITFDCELSIHSEIFQSVLWGMKKKENCSLPNLLTFTTDV